MSIKIASNSWRTTISMASLPFTASETRLPIFSSSRVASFWFTALSSTSNKRNEIGSCSIGARGFFSGNSGVAMFRVFRIARCKTERRIGRLRNCDIPSREVRS
jgi:hypothetical protein